MPDVSLNGIEFKIRGSSNEASASVQHLIDKVNELRSSMSGLKSVQTTANALKNVGNAAKKAATPLSNFASSLKRIAFYRILRGILKSITQAFKEGLKNAYEFSKATGDQAGLAKALDTLATKSLTMKNQLGAAFGGLLTAITPIVVQIIGLVTKLAEAISRLMAILGGSDTYLRAKDVWTEWGDAAASAGGAAKKALEYLAPFDELNVLPDPKSGGGGGGAASNIADMFEYASVEDGQGFGDILQGWLDGIANFFETTDWAGLADKAWEGLKNAFSDSGSATSVIRSLFEALGAACGAAASFAITFVKNVVKDIWGYFKQYIKDDNGDGKITGEEIIKGIWEGIKNAVKNVGTWIKTNIFDPFIKGFKAAFGISSPAAQMKPYGKYIAEGILEGIKNVFTNIKTWVSDNILKPIQKAIDTAKEKIKVGIEIVKKGWTTVTAWVNATAQKGKDAVEKGISIIRNGWTYVSTWITDKFMGKSTPEKGIGIARKGWTYISSWIMDKFMGATTPEKAIGIVRNGWTTISNWISNSFMGDALSKGIGLAKSGWETVTKWISNSFLGAALNKGIGLAKSGWKTVYDWMISNKYVGQAIQMGVELIKKGWTNFINWILGKDQTVPDDITQNVDIKVDDWSINPSISDSSGRLNLPANVDIQSVGGSVNAQVTVSKPTLGESTRTALGGAFYGGNWHSIPQYASGGAPHGSLFVAGEAGAELVGHIGGRTEVLNQSQIAASIAAGVHRTLSASGVRAGGSYSLSDGSNEDILYRAFRRALDETDFGGDVELDGDTIYRAMVRRNRANTRLTGVNAMA